MNKETIYVNENTKRISLEGKHLKEIYEQGKQEANELWIKKIKEAQDKLKKGIRKGYLTCHEDVDKVIDSIIGGLYEK